MCPQRYPSSPSELREIKYLFTYMLIIALDKIDDQTPPAPHLHTNHRDEVKPADFQPSHSIITPKKKRTTE
jgi:hypothetical protein